MSERICGIDLYGVYRRGNDLFRVLTIADRPTMTLKNVETGETIGGVIGAAIFDDFVELVPKQASAGRSSGEAVQAREGTGSS